MKFLLENWRGYLNERKTDELYSRLVDFFVDAYSDPQNFEYESEGEKEDYEDSDWLDDEMLKRLAGFKKIDPNELRDHALLLVIPRRHEIVEKVREVDPKGELISQDIDREGHWLPSIEIKFDKESGAMGSWNSGTRELTLYFNSIMDEETYRQISDDDDIINIMRSSNYKSLLRYIFDHELTHFINATRAGNEDGLMSRNYWKTKRGKEIYQYIKDNFPGLEWTEGIAGVEKQIRYINSTEEIQARLIPIFKLVQNFVNSSEEVDIDTETDDLNFIRDEIEKEKPDVRKIIKYMKNIYDFRHQHYWELTIKPLQNKILQRLYQFALHMIEVEK